MGTIKVSGYAERKVEVDTARYEIEFKDAHTDVGATIEKVNKNCELFLEKIKPYFDVKQFQLELDDQNKSYWYEKEKIKSYSRVISLTTNASAKTNNFIHSIIKENNIGAYVRVEYSYSKIQELHKELLKEAILNSKEKAQIITGAIGNRILSLEKVSFDRYDFDEEEIKNIKCYYDKSLDYEESQLSDELSNKLNLESEEVFVVWNVD